jgi:hypothetical protein
MEEIQLHDLGLAHLAFDLKQEPAEALEIVFPFGVFPPFVLQEVEVLGFGQLAKGNDFTHWMSLLWEIYHPALWN